MMREDDERDDNEVRVDIEAVDDTAPRESEEALALEFAGRHATDLRFVAPWGKWFVWDGAVWREDTRRQVFTLARQLCREYARVSEKKGRDLASAKMRAAVVALASEDADLVATTDQWDTDPFLLNTPAGVVDLRTGTPRAAQPGDYMRMTTSIAPARVRADGSLGCPRWIEFLNQIFNNDAELVSYIQRVLGYALTGEVSEQELYFLHGSGQNGKGVLILVVSKIMGSYHCGAPVETFMEGKFDHHPTELAMLIDKRLVTTVETDKGRRWNESRIKQLTGSDEVQARFMRQDFFWFYPKLKLFVAGNHLPVLSDVGPAMARRLKRIPFNVKIADTAVNKNLAKELLASEGAAILLWMIEGCLKWQRDGMKPPGIVTQATADYLNSQDTLGEWIEDCCERDATAEAGTTTLYHSWMRWTNYRKLRGGSHKQFSENLKERGFEKRRAKTTQTHMVFAGLKLKPEDEGSGGEPSFWAPDR